MSGLNHKTYLLGYSGHAYVVAEAARLSGVVISGYLQREPSDENPMELGYAGFEGQNDFVGWGQESSYILGVGDNRIREKLAELVSRKGKEVLRVVHPEASISKISGIGKGTFVARGVLVNPLAYVGRNVILNTGSIIEHECIIGDSSHIAPGAVLAGNVRVGKRSFVGANSVIRQGVVIGDDVTIGAGSVVLKDIEHGQTWVGNPAKPMQS